MMVITFFMVVFCVLETGVRGPETDYFQRRPETDYQSRVPSQRG